MSATEGVTFAPGHTAPSGSVQAHASRALAEADRLMTVCNSCRYCEGLCAVFPAMEMRRAFADGDLNYLANLCHACGACYVDCQFSPPHEFDVNVPKILAQVRNNSYAAYAWPPALRGLFARNGLAVAVISALSIAAFILGFFAWNDATALWRAGTEPGAFYRLMPHSTMALLFGICFVFALLSLAMGLRAFWRDIGEPAATLVAPAPLWRAVKDAASLRYLDGGKAGCFNEGEVPDDRRRLYHHLTFFGFLLCFAATCVATLYHYVGGREAPYAWYDLPVLFGTVGGVGLVIGAAGLLRTKFSRDPAMIDRQHLGMDTGFIAMLLAVAGTGLLLLALRGTVLMGLLLALHLGTVLAFFLTMPYSKFVHGLYRFAALVRYAREREQLL